ncbi:MAG: hypothetical protein ACK5MU_00305 [Candidatus Saccharimonadales bacterium]
MKKVALGVMLAVFVGTPFMTMQSYAAGTVTIANVKQTLEEAANMHLITHIMSKCIPSITSTGIGGSNAQAGKIFSGTTNIATGPWLENEIQGKVDNAEIWCSNEQVRNILQLFAEKLKAAGVVDGVQDVICNKDDVGKGGLLARYSVMYTEYGSYKGTIDDVDCYRFDDNSRSYYLNDSANGGEAYIQKLYAEYAATNKYVVPYSTLGTYDKTDGYFLYLNDFKIDCGSEVIPESSVDGSSKFSVPLKTVNQDGEIIEQWIRPNNGRSDTSKIGNSFVTAGKGLTCAETMTKINTYVADFQNAMFDVIRDECKRVLEAEMLKIETDMNNILNNDSASEESTTAAQGVLDEIAKIKASGDFTKATDAGGLVCIDSEDIPGLSDVVQVEYKDPSSGVDTAEPSCFDGGGALGWILCPVLEAMGEAASNIYEGIIEPFLAVDSTLFSDSGAGAGTYAAWTTFQSIANIAFIILLLVVVFSQLTGVGIDNYGIKKILPKLIIAAILINLSYFICQLAVDVSNVLGYGLKAMLDSMANSGDIAVAITTDAGTATTTVSGGATVLTAVAALIAVGAGAGIIMAGGIAFILPALLALLSAIIAIVFTFVLLGVRQAGVVLLVVISPLAFVCYMLPNTKKLFDKWVKMFQGLLLFFPICGLLMGAGNLTSKILLSTNSKSFFMALIAMLLNIIPLFFLPSLLKGAFAAMGNIGAKISGLGKSMSGGIDKRIKNSDGYKQQYSRMRAGMNKKGELTRFGKMRNSAVNRTGIGKASMARGASAVLKDNAERDKMARLTDPTYLAAARARQEADVQDEQVKTEEALITQGADANDVNALGSQLQNAISTDVGGSNSAKIRALQNVLSGKGDAGRQQVHNAMRGAQAAGAVSNEARQAYSNNLMNNWAKDYKDNSRSTYDYAKNNTGATAAGTIASHEARSVGSLKQEQMVAMDEQELNRYMNSMGAMSAGDQAKLQALAYDAVNNEQIAQSLKGDQREILQKIANGDTVDASTGSAMNIGAYTAPVSAQQAQQDAVFDIQRQTLQAAHEQTAASRGTETVHVGGAIAGTPVTGYAAPTGFDVNNAANVSRNANGEHVVTNASGQKWNINRGRYEN